MFCPSWQLFFSLCCPFVAAHLKHCPVLYWCLLELEFYSFVQGSLYLCSPSTKPRRTLNFAVRSKLCTLWKWYIGSAHSHEESFASVVLFSLSRWNYISRAKQHTESLHDLSHNCQVQINGLRVLSFDYPKWPAQRKWKIPWKTQTSATPNIK